MKTAKLKTFLRSPTASLAGTYLLIIMVLSISFSFVFYRTSAHELGRQIPPDSFFNGGVGADIAKASGGIQYQMPGSVNSFFRHRVDEGRMELRNRLIILNIGALLVGSVLSYVLARRNLQPIEEAMDAQIQFVSDASHELRTPLTAIQTSNEVFLRKQKATTSEARQVIARNTEDVVRLRALSDGLLNLASGQKTDFVVTPVVLQDIANEAMNQVVTQATEHDIAVHDELPDVKVMGERASLAQVLIILLDNAVKYSQEHGNVYLQGTVKGRHAYIIVKDEGIGIRASDLPHIFRRFYRADAARTHDSKQAGYGLGLAIAQQIILQQGGDIMVSSTPGKGSTFTVKLPIA